MRTGRTEKNYGLQPVPLHRQLLVMVLSSPLNLLEEASCASASPYNPARGRRIIILSDVCWTEKLDNTNKHGSTRKKYKSPRVDPGL